MPSDPLPGDDLPYIFGRTRLHKVTAEKPEPGVASANVPDPGAAQGHVGQEPRSAPPFAPNIIHILMDDAGRLQFPGYAGENSWPEDYPYPPTPWFDSKVADGIRYTKARVSPRCSPHRACALSGRRAHVSPGHPHGTLVGEVPNSEYLDDDYPFLGLRAEHRPLPEVADTANSGYRHALFGKYHLFHYEGGNGEQYVQDYLAPVDIAGFELFHETVLSGAGGGPYYGYYDFPIWIVTKGSPSTAVRSEHPGGVFNGTYIFDQITSWLGSVIGDGDKFNLQWWSHMPHGLLPALNPGIGPDLGSGAEDLYTGNFTQAECVGSSTVPGDNATSPDGKTANGGYDEDGNVDGRGLYGPQGKCNVNWRRQYTMIQVFDALCSLLEEWLTTNHPEVAKNTLWMVASDNGITQSDFVPIEDDISPIDGQAHSYTVLPPTVDDTEGGEQYHVAADAKGSAHDEGILTPMVVWGDMLPERVRGAKCPALIESTDWYPTLLDIMAGPVPPGDESGRLHWREAIGATDLAKVDGVSFKDTFFDLTAGTREYAFAQVFGPAAAPVGEETWIERCVVNRSGWKLHRELDEGSAIDAWHLYDTQNDPREKIDLYAAAVAGTNAVAAANLADLQAEYDRIMA